MVKPVTRKKVDTSSPKRYHCSLNGYSYPELVEGADPMKPSNLLNSEWILYFETIRLSEGAKLRQGL